MGNSTRDKRHSILLITNAGFGETPVPSDTVLQPGDVLRVSPEHEGLGVETIEALCVAVVPVGSAVEYAIADQAEPKQPRPLTLQIRKPHKETLYVIQLPNEDEPRLYSHTQMVSGGQKAQALSGEHVCIRWDADRFCIECGLLPEDGNPQFGSRPPSRDSVGIRSRHEILAAEQAK